MFYRSLAPALLAATALAPASANAASLLFAFDQAKSGFKVTSNTPNCVVGDCSLTGQLLTLPAPLTVEEGNSTTFNFGQLTVGRGLGADFNSVVSATLAFTSPLVDSYSSTAGAFYLTAFGVVSAGGVNWTTPAKTFTGDYGSFTVDFVDSAGFFGRTANTAVTITVNSANSIPESATWAMMILGFGAVGFAMRRRKAIAIRSMSVSYA